MTQPLTASEVEQWIGAAGAALKYSTFCDPSIYQRYIREGNPQGAANYAWFAMWEQRDYSGGAPVHRTRLLALFVRRVVRWVYGVVPQGPRGYGHRLRYRELTPTQLREVAKLLQQGKPRNERTHEPALLVAYELEHRAIQIEMDKFRKLRAQHEAQARKWKQQ